MDQIAQFRKSIYRINNLWLSKDLDDIKKPILYCDRRNKLWSQEFNIWHITNLVLEKHKQYTYLWPFKFDTLHLMKMIKKLKSKAVCIRNDVLTFF